ADLVGEDIAALNRSPGVVMGDDTGLLIAMDFAAADDGVAALLDLNAGSRIRKDVAALDCALALLIDQEDRNLLAVVALAVPEYRLSVFAVNRDAGQGLRGNIAAFHHEVSSRDAHGIALSALPADQATQRYSSHRRGIRGHDEAGAARTFDYYRFWRPLTQQ